MKKILIKFTATIILLNITTTPQNVLAANNANLQNEIYRNNQQIDSLEEQKESINDQKESANKDLQSILSKISVKKFCAS